MICSRGITKAAPAIQDNKDPSPAIGVILANVGSPDAPTYAALFKYLGAFLSDRRVVTLHPILWRPILYGIILPFRSGTSATKYRRIWTEQGSPLVFHTLNHTHKISAALNNSITNSPIVVTNAMRYGNPSIKMRIKEMEHQGINKLLVLPLYPQPASPTVLSVFDSIWDTLRGSSYAPSVRLVSGYWTDPLYIQAVSKTITEHWKTFGKPNRLLVSYHGIPVHMQDQEPYASHCLKTTQLLRQQIQLSETDIETVFQSRFGFQKWLRPTLEERLKFLIKEGCRKIDIVCPGFAMDCLETLDEVQNELITELMDEHMDCEIRYIPCLNSSEDHVEMTIKLIKNNILGWA